MKALFSQAMIDNASPTVGTYEEFETGPWHGTGASPKRSWGGAKTTFSRHFFHRKRPAYQVRLGTNARKTWKQRGVSAGIPDMWFTSELLNLLRDVLIHEDEAEGALWLFHGAPDTWRSGDELSIQAMPLSFGVSVSVATTWGDAQSHLALQLATTGTHMYAGGQASGTTGRALRLLRVHVGSCSQILKAKLSSFSRTTGMPDAEVGIAARCEEGGVVVVEHRSSFLATESGSCSNLALELEVAH
jgi:hypothetical protein